MAQSTQTKDHEEAEADAQQCVKERLDSDAIDHQDEQAEAKQERECLEPDERSARVAGSGFRLFGEFFYFTGCPVVCEVFSRIDQGSVLSLCVISASLCVSLRCICLD